MVRKGPCCLQRLHRTCRFVYLLGIEQLARTSHCCVLRVTCCCVKDCCLVQQYFVLAGVQGCL